MPGDDGTIPLGVADAKREGDDITLVATSSMVLVALGRQRARGDGNQCGSDRSAHDLAARRKGPDRIGEENVAGDRLDVGY